MGIVHRQLIWDWNHDAPATEHWMQGLLAPDPSVLRMSAKYPADPIYPPSLTPRIPRASTLWLIRASWSIGGAGVPLIHRQARIHHGNGKIAAGGTCATRSRADGGYPAQPVVGFGLGEPHPERHTPISVASIDS
jgi:hypothetical protein